MPDKNIDKSLPTRWMLGIKVFMKIREKQPNL